MESKCLEENGLEERFFWREQREEKKKTNLDEKVQAFIATRFASIISKDSKKKGLVDQVRQKKTVRGYLPKKSLFFDY